MLSRCRYPCSFQFIACCVQHICRQYLLEAEWRVIKSSYFYSKSFSFRDKLNEQEFSSSAPLRAQLKLLPPSWAMYVLTISGWQHCQLHQQLSSRTHFIRYWWPCLTEAWDYPSPRSWIFTGNPVLLIPFSLPVTGYDENLASKDSEGLLCKLSLLFK